jgi:hypothetical protein
MKARCVDEVTEAYVSFGAPEQSLDHHHLVAAVGSADADCLLEQGLRFQRLAYEIKREGPIVVERDGSIGVIAP